jgi:SRSO17 transposase
VLFDAGYGNDSKLREGISAEGLTYSGGILPQTLVWKPGLRPGRKSKSRESKNGKPKRDTVSVKQLALGLPAKAWRTIKWREGTNDWLSSRFARVHVAVAPSHEPDKKPTKEWLLIEWPKGEAEPTKYWLSTLPEAISLRNLVDASKLRWRIERDYQELKQEVGLPEEPPLRPERHVPNSIAIMRIRIIDALVRLLPRCPYCGKHATVRGRRNL